MQELFWRYSSVGGLCDGGTETRRGGEVMMNFSSVSPRLCGKFWKVFLLGSYLAQALREEGDLVLAASLKSCSKVRSTFKGFSCVALGRAWALVYVGLCYFISFPLSQIQNLLSSTSKRKANCVEFSWPKISRYVVKPCQKKYRRFSFKARTPSSLISLVYSKLKIIFADCFWPRASVLIRELSMLLVLLYLGVYEKEVLLLSQWPPLALQCTAGVSPAFITLIFAVIVLSRTSFLSVIESTTTQALVCMI